jgi:hypothetical protein
MRFILGPILVAVGILMMKYTVKITEFTGKIDFAEEYLGKGLAAGTYTWWRLVGLVMAILGAMWFLGMLDIVGNALVAVFGGPR